MNDRPDPTRDDQGDLPSSARGDTDRLWPNAAAFPFVLLVLAATAFILWLLTR
jgi:hypothetical protein